MADPLRVFTVTAGAFDASTVRLRDLLDIGTAAGVDPLALGDVLGGRSADPTARLRTVAAYAWIVARRDDPSLTFADVLNGRVEVAGAPDATFPDADAGAGAGAGVG